MHYRLRKKLALTGWLLSVLSFIYIIHNRDGTTQSSKPRRNRFEMMAGLMNNMKEEEIDTHCLDCPRKNKLLEEWPEDKPKGVIYVLTKNNRFQSLLQLLKSVNKHFNAQYRYPIIIFYEQMDSNNKLAVQNVSSVSDVFFQKVEFKVPTFLDNVKQDIECTSTIGYRHMCRFHVKGVYQEDIMDGFDYNWRFDDDSLLTRRVHYDVFEFMKSHDILYGYIWIHVDSYLCTKGLWEAAEEFISQTKIKPQYFHKWKKPKLFYNNFEISSRMLWDSDDYRTFIQYIDELGGIYDHRWGDASIKGIAVSMFVPENQTHHFKNIGYSHGTFKT